MDPLVRIALLTRMYHLHCGYTPSDLPDIRRSSRRLNYRSVFRIYNYGRPGPRPRPVRAPQSEAKSAQSVGLNSSCMSEAYC